MSGKITGVRKENNEFNGSNGNKPVNAINNRTAFFTVIMCKKPQYPKNIEVNQ